MKIGLCMSVIGAGGGNDTVFYSIKNFLQNQGHIVTEFSNTINDNSKVPKFGLFRQLQTINHSDIHNQDLLIFLTGIPSSTKVPIVYYHQQLPSVLFSERPIKYQNGIWRIYYNIFSFFAKSNSQYLQEHTHYCISKYLQQQFSNRGILVNILRPAIIKNDLPVFDKLNRVVTICRISPEKNLHWNMKVLTGYRYRIFGTVNRFTAYYHKELQRRLEPYHDIVLDVNRVHMLEYLLNSKVYFSSSKETLGLAVLEGISAGCIPVVPSNTGNIETVPFRELRYQENDIIHARELVNKAMNGGFDYLLPELQKHVKQYTEENYKSFFADKVRDVEKND